jgi:hypothetical protein
MTIGECSSPRHSLTTERGVPYEYTHISASTFAMVTQISLSNAAHPLPTTDEGRQPELPWHAVYPQPQSQPQSISRDEVLQLLKSNTTPKKDFVLVDVRRTDFEVDGVSRSS